MKFLSKSLQRQKCNRQKWSKLKKILGSKDKPYMRENYINVPIVVNY